MAKIDIYCNGKYLCSTQMSKTPKDACEAIRAATKNGIVKVAGQGGVLISPDDLITAEYDTRDSIQKP